jgi:hypothetical protein
MLSAIALTLGRERADRTSVRGTAVAEKAGGVLRAHVALLLADGGHAMYSWLTIVDSLIGSS